jgi:hypothetical protein
MDLLCGRLEAKGGSQDEAFRKMALLSFGYEIRANQDFVGFFENQKRKSN